MCKTLQITALHYLSPSVCVCVCAYVEQMIAVRENTIATNTSQERGAFVACFMAQLHFSPLLSVKLQIQINYVSENYCYQCVCVCGGIPG